MAESPRCVSRALRLFIKEMIMRNVKSYADEQRVGPFHKVRCFFFFTVIFVIESIGRGYRKLKSFYSQSFSAVVVLNRNGSGKSNIIDAMLFMFGKRAKQVRYE
ncbi:hypothetical protein AABB24_003102 [Solanum stoloniferum]|uniref:RecF/RecN/SMC N-terminal domain-containing protein n=1 Tax=Solanum stoloniferum TaxID=62892 RepID=A0ABD2V622_9SOLN